MMDSRVTVTICDEEYTFVAQEAPSYMQRVGAYVNSKMSEVMSSSRVSRSDGAVLAAANITDELFRAQEAAEGLRRQVKEYLDEATRAKNEASELRRQLFKLQNPPR